MLFQDIEGLIVRFADAGIELADGCVHFLDAVEVLVVGEVDECVMCGHDFQSFHFRKEKECRRKSTATLLEKMTLYHPESL